MTDAPFQSKRAKRKWYQFMLDIAWPELIVIGIVAVVAIGPKDLPRVMNVMGRWVGKARMMANDVQRSLEQINYEAQAAERVKQDREAPPVTPAATVHHHHHHNATQPAPPAAKDDSHDNLGSP